jgi:hypothetical protein
MRMRFEANSGRRRPLAALLFLLTVSTGRGADNPPVAAQAPNLVVNISAKLAGSLFGSSVDRQEPVRDRILKADVYGTGHTVGRVTAQLVPSSDRAAIDLVMNTQLAALTTGYQGPVQLHNIQNASIEARKRIYLDADGFHAEPACSHNQTDLNLQGISTRFRGPILNCTVHRLAERKYSHTKEQVTQIVESHVDRQVQEAFDKDAAEQLEASERSFKTDLRDPLKKRSIFPDSQAISTTAQWLTIAMRLGETSTGLASPPGATDRIDFDLLARLHESYVLTATRRMFAGKTYSMAQLRTDFAEMSKTKPREPTDEEKSTALTFAADEPVSVRFADDQIHFTIHPTLLASNGREYPGMDIGVVYHLEKTPAGVRATRVGDLQIYPPNHVPGTPLNSRQTSQRALLKRHLGDVVPPTIDLGQITLPESLNKVGKLITTQARTLNGWLVIGLAQSEVK